jgi:hypothetical protein
MTDLTQIAWLAGLLEGEGTFHTSHTGSFYVRVTLEMTDEDVVRKAAQLMEDAPVSGPRIRKKGLGTKPYYSTSISGYKASRVMAAVLPFMGRRRAAKIRELIHLWEYRPNVIRRREMRLPPTCHADRKHYSRGLCQPCHYQKYKKRAMNPNDSYHKPNVHISLYRQGVENLMNPETSNGV